MRIQEEFAKERITNQRIIKKKYFIVSEGAKTEPCYFNGLSGSSLCQNVSLINLMRDDRFENISHPKRIVEFIKNYIKINKQNSITSSDLIETLYNYRNDYYDSFSDNEFECAIQLIRDMYESNESIKLEEINDLIYKVLIQIGKNNYIENVTKYIKYHNTLYVPNVDKINLVIDRDPHNFSKQQFEEVVRACEENKINLYVSNPCFEFWLYLHFDEIEFENREQLLKNGKPNNNSKRRFIEIKLSEICGYKKNKLDFSKFECNVHKAIEREKDYEEDLNELEHKLGSNVGLLVEELIQ